MEIENILGYLLNTSARLIKRSMDNKLNDYQITTAQWAVIKLLDSWDRLTQTEIAIKLNSDKATTGSVITRLRKKGLVEKHADKQDDRVNIISLTNHAKVMVKQIEQLAIINSLQAMEGLSEDEKTKLIQALKQIIRNLSEEEKK